MDHRPWTIDHRPWNNIRFEVYLFYECSVMATHRNLCLESESKKPFCIPTTIDHGPWSMVHGLSLRMNFLAHAYLSFNDPDILAGNMISDFVKGKKQYEYPPMIQKGIKLHRLIDTFTDEHSATRQIMQFFRPAYRLYSGAFTDIVYDYFLANDSNEFTSAEELEKFSINTYALMEQKMDKLPEDFQAMFPHMRKQNWLYNYRKEEGIMKSFNGMASRARYITESATAYSVFINNMGEMQQSYQEFFPLLKNYTAATLKELLNTD